MRALRRMYPQRRHSAYRRAFGSARGECAGGGQHFAQERRRDGAGGEGGGLTMNRADLPANVCVADDVKLGDNVRLAPFVNLYGCEVGDDTRIGAFVEVQK